MGKKPEIFSLARLHLDQSFEDVFGGMKTLLDEGLFGAFGASELKRETLEKANKVRRVLFHPLALFDDAA